MRKLIALGIMLFAVIQISSTPVIAQDFNALLEAVEKIEANLKQLIEQEAATRTVELAKINLQLKSVTAGPDSTVELLRNGLHYLKSSKASEIGPKLASTDNQAAMQIAFGHEES